jgi:hypothetical protein
MRGTAALPAGGAFGTKSPCADRAALDTLAAALSVRMAAAARIGSGITAITISRSGGWLSRGGWTATASVDYGSGRPTNRAPREAIPQCAATAPPKTSPSYCRLHMARPAQTESSPLRRFPPAVLDGLDADHARAGIALIGCRPP